MANSPRPENDAATDEAPTGPGELGRTPPTQPPPRG
jgi:hypothetical protein